MRRLSPHHHLSLSWRALVQVCFLKQSGDVIGMETVTQASANDNGKSVWLAGVTGYQDTAVAVIVAGDRILERADGDRAAAVHFQLNHRVTVFCFSAISVVHTPAGGSQPSDS